MVNDSVTLPQMNFAELEAGGCRLARCKSGELGVARAARGLAVRARADISFVEADTYDAVQVLGADRFDLVYTGIGALCWLPSSSRWADVVAGLLRGGRLSPQQDLSAR